MVVIITCKNEDPFKIKNARLVTTFSRYKSMGIFPYAQGQVTRQSQAWSCRISNPFKLLWVSSLYYLQEWRSWSNQNEGAIVVTPLIIKFSDAQGQLTS